MAKNFDPKNVSVIIGGHTVKGYADGTFAAFSQNKDSFALTVGADGEGARTKSNDKSGRLTVTILQSSLSNDVLSAFHNAGTQFACLVKDFNGTTLAACATGWMVRNPDFEFGNEIANREYIIESDAWDVLVGGISN